MAPESPSAFVHRFVHDLATSDIAAVRDAFDADVTAYVTNAEGGADRVEGREAVAARFPDFGAMADTFDATVTQVHEIDDRTALFMVEIRAARRGQRLHNFAGFLVRLTDRGTMAEFRMVEALPAESDRFWSA